MDVDNNDVEGQLLRQFSSMGTTDKEVLIAELQKLIGNQLNIDGCAFFLDMNNWNLQAAICAFYDYDQPSLSTTRPSMCLVKDATIGEGESITPNTQFVKTWRIQNNGSESWPPGCCLRYFSGEQFGCRDRVMVDALAPGLCVDVSIPMVSPQRIGVSEGQWRMQTGLGSYFGDVVWAIISVEENGILGVTQQLSQFGGDFLSSQGVVPSEAVSDTANPFSSPSKTDQTMGHSAVSSAPICNHFGGSPVASNCDSALIAQDVIFLNVVTDTAVNEMETSHEVDMS